MGSKGKYLLAAIIASIIWGFFSITLKQLTAYPSDVILIYRIFLSVSIASLICLIFRRKYIAAEWQQLKQNREQKNKKLLYLFVGSTLLVTTNWFAFIYVINHVSVQAGAFAYMVCPILTALCAFFILKERLRNQQWWAIVISIISISLLAIRFYEDVFFSVVIAVLYALYLILQKQIEGINKFHILTAQLLLSSMLILPYFFFVNHSLPMELHFWTNIAIIAVCFTLIPLFLNLYSLQGLSSATVGIIIYVNPITAFIVAFFYFDERSGPLQIAAYGLLVVAVLLFNWNAIQSLRKPTTH